MDQLSTITIPFAIDSTISIESLANLKLPAKLLELWQERAGTVRRAFILNWLYSYLLIS